MLMTTKNQNLNKQFNQNLNSKSATIFFFLLFYCSSSSCSPCLFLVWWLKCTLNSVTSICLEREVIREKTRMYTVKRPKMGPKFWPQNGPYKMGPILPLQKRAKFGPPFTAILAPHSRTDLAPLVAKQRRLDSSSQSIMGTSRAFSHSCADCCEVNISVA